MSQRQPVSTSWGTFQQYIHAKRTGDQVRIDGDKLMSAMLQRIGEPPGGWRFVVGPNNELIIEREV